jgi:hypothetical protein
MKRKCTTISSINKTILVIVLLVLCQLRINAISINVEVAGTLNSKISDKDKNAITELTLSGQLNGTDIKFIRAMAGSDENGDATDGSLEKLDMKDANIVSGGDYYYIDSNETYYTSDNVIGDRMFFKCNSLKEITLPNSVNKIKSYAIRNCKNITSVIIGNNVTDIEEYGISVCASLKTVNIPNCVNKLEEYALAGNATLAIINIGSGVSSIARSTFGGCGSLKEINIDKDNKFYSSIDGILFDKAIKELIKFPKKSDIVDYTIPEGVEKIDSSAFSQNVNLKTVVLPHSLKLISPVSFELCKSLESIDLVDGIDSVGDWSFWDCEALKSVRIAANIQKIGNAVFYKCINLSEIWNYSSIPQTINHSVFDEVDKSTCALYVPEGTLESYKNSEIWKDFININEFDATGISRTHESEEISLLGRKLTNNSNKSCSVYSVEGKLIYHSVDKSSVELNKGIYVVKIGNYIKKVVIK